MPTVTNNEDALKIHARFFEAIDTLIEQKKIRGLGSFTRANDLNYGNFFQVRKFPETKILKPEFLLYLCRDFGVNPTWLILGEGEMFREQQ